jgi:hypothetical protein
MNHMTPNPSIEGTSSSRLRLLPSAPHVFRGWVRKLSGAERYSKQVAAAIAAGSIRRAFLKGLGQAAACPVPATPLR